MKRYRGAGCIACLRLDGWLYLEYKLVLFGRNAHTAAVRQLAEQQLVGKRLINPVTNQPAHGSSPHGRVVAMLCQPLAGRVFHT